ncbi:CocE/NonD family hydrolase [Leifsonia sp. YAF41]|uniref:CocE/NonD family hydrolase n=1 Tax=Leifsonia sp. YAF41 TaxID=3233086 RepID=UPI003F9E9900
MAGLETVPQSEADDRALHTVVTTRDGIRLATDVYLPGTGSTPAPTVLIRLPYDKTGRYTFIPQIGAHFAAHGFAVVTQDVRGKYLSEGERNPFVNEVNDGVDTVDWIIAQDWSDGNVGTWGDSYYGFTQWALASSGHPALKAIVPRVTGHRFMDMSPGGGLPTLTLLDWLIDAWSISDLVLNGGTDHSSVPAIDMVHPELTDGDALFRRYVLTELEQPEDLVRRVFPKGDPAALLPVPALHTGGWFDNLQFWQLDDWESSLGSTAGAHQYLRMWSSDHEDYRWRPRATPLGADFGLSSDALAEHIPALLAEPISFFNHYLRGGEGRWAAAQVSYELCGVGDRDAASWPPASSRMRVFGLSSTGDLVAEGEGTSGGVVEWEHRPDAPLPFPIESEWDQNRGGVPDESALCSRDDVATFDSAAMDADYDLVGRIELTARIEAPSTRTHLVARLYDVDQSGDARFIVGNGFDVLADGQTEFQLRLGDTAYRVPAGHRLRLLVATSLSGQYPVHPGTDENPWTATDHRAARQRLLLDGAALTLPEDCG